MALTAEQVIDLSCQVAKCPAFTTQGLQLLNAVLQELLLDYDFLSIRKSFDFTFDTGATGLGYAPGSGPNLMPDDFVRLHRGGGFYKIFQVPYVLIGVTQEEFDTFVQQPGLASYPYLAYVDIATKPAGLYVWPPASGNYPATIRYNPVMPDITDTTQVPWFPNSTYLIARLSGELMRITNDDRMQAFLSDQPGSGGAGELLRKYLVMKDDPETAPKSVKLDPRMFKASIATLRNTKTIGWLLAIGWFPWHILSDFIGRSVPCLT